jgi:hypothetical protein
MIAKHDLLDALEHAGMAIDDYAIDGPGLNLSDFIVSPIHMIDIQDIPDDISAWAEWDQGDLLEYEEGKERDEELERFRGRNFAQRAKNWTPRNMPPVVIVSTPEIEILGDGRGRVSYAIGMDWQKVPCVWLFPR